MIGLFFSASVLAGGTSIGYFLLRLFLPQSQEWENQKKLGIGFIIGVFLAMVAFAGNAAGQPETGFVGVFSVLAVASIFGIIYRKLLNIDESVALYAVKKKTKIPEKVLSVDEKNKAAVGAIKKSLKTKKTSKALEEISEKGAPKKISSLNRPLKKFLTK